MNKLLKKLKQFKYKRISSHVYQKKESGAKATIVFNKSNSKVYMAKITYMLDDGNYLSIFKKLKIEQRVLEDLVV